MQMIRVTRRSVESFVAEILEKLDQFALGLRFYRKIEVERCTRRAVRRKAVSSDQGKAPATLCQMIHHHAEYPIEVHW